MQRFFVFAFAWSRQKCNALLSLELRHDGGVVGVLVIMHLMQGRDAGQRTLKFLSAQTDSAVELQYTVCI